MGRTPVSYVCAFVQFGCTQPPYPKTNAGGVAKHRHQKNCKFDPEKVAAAAAAAATVIINGNNNTIVSGTTTNNNTTNITVNNTTNTTIVVPRSFGKERIAELIELLTEKQLRALVDHPEDAVTSDLVNMIHFNLDFPKNHTLRVSDGEIQAFFSKDDYSAGKWSKISKAELLNNMAVHFNKVYAHVFAPGGDSWDGRWKAKLKCRTVMETIADNKDQKICIECTAMYHEFDNHVVSVKRMQDRADEVVRANCALPQEDWVRTTQYAKANIADDDD